MDMEIVSKWCAVAAVIVLALGVVLPAVSDDRKAFMHECQDNGMRHYQCVAIWRSGASLLIIPTPGSNYHNLPLDVN